MLKKIFNALKKVILAVLFIYGYNKLTLPFNLIIPLNFFTVFLISFFGIPSIFMIVLFSLVCV